MFGLNSSLKYSSLTLPMCCLILGLGSPIAWADSSDLLASGTQPVPSGDVAELVDLRPENAQAFALHTNGDRKRLEIGDSLTANMYLETDKRSWAQLFVEPELVVWVGPGALTQIRHLQPERSVFALVEGYIRVTLGHLGFGPREVEVQTDTVLAAVRGTDFVMSRSADGLVRVHVYEGQVELQFHGSVVKVLGPGEGLSLEESGRVREGFGALPVIPEFQISALTDGPYFKQGSNFQLRGDELGDVGQLPLTSGAGGSWSIDIVPPTSEGQP